jgi:hypothetical protein
MSRIFWGFLLVDLVRLVFLAQPVRENYCVRIPCSMATQSWDPCASCVGLLAKLSAGRSRIIAGVRSDVNLAVRWCVC